jgi:hypothetical protein
VSDFTSGTVASAGTAQQAGTAVFATNASTAVSVSGSAITQSQVVNLVSDLANTAKLDTANTFTVGGHVITNAATAVVPLVLKGVASQSTDLLQVKNSGNTNLFRVDQFGGIYSTFASFTSDAAATRPLLVKGAASQSANLQEWQESNAGTPSAINATGQLRVRTFNTSYGFTAFGVGAGAATEIPIVVRGAASQSANLLEIQSSAAAVLLSVTSAGNLNAPGQVRVGTTSGLAQLSVVSTNAATIAQVVRGAASQSANLQEWQNSGGTALAKVDSSGNIFGTQLRTMTSYVNITESNSGGSIRLLKATAAAAPLANEVRLQVLTGTNVNTLKLVAVGPNGTAITILDNLA